MMFEFKWEVPAAPHKHVVLQVGSEKGWFGRKRLLCGGRVVRTRGYFEGIEDRFYDPDSGAALQLKLLQVKDSATWRPALFHEGREVPELTGARPPYIPPRPRIVSVATGVTFLFMFMAAIMLPSIINILNALRLPHADRKLVLTVGDPAADASDLVIEPQRMPIAQEGEEYSASLEASGGQPPYSWEPIYKAWPKHIVLDSKTGEIRFTPYNPFDVSASFLVTDAAGNQEAGAFAVVVKPKEPPPADWPTIATGHLPPAQFGQEYEAELEASGGQGQLSWHKLSGALPRGLKLDGEKGRIHGTPKRKMLFTHPPDFQPDLQNAMVTPHLRHAFERHGVILGHEPLILTGARDTEWTILDKDTEYAVALEEGELRFYEHQRQFPVTLRVEDNVYHAGQDVYPWVPPVIVTTICLIGFWNMRRWSVYVFAALIAAQLVTTASGLFEISYLAIGLQAAVWAVGAAHAGKMN